MIDRLNANSISVDQLIERHARDDPAFGEEWERTAFAREVAHAVIRYRVDHDLSIEQLAELLAVDSETIGELEDGESDPDVGMLRRLSAHLGLRFTLDIRPAGSTGAEITYSVA
jgi:ribosome-binding protein aMBF1 (putative translation factor)